MGLLDILNGMQNGPRGPSDPEAKGEGMSPVTMAILAMLAYKAFKHFGGGQAETAPAPQAPSTSAPGNTINAGLPGGLGDLLGGGNSGGGGLGGLLKGGLGGLLAGGAAGSVLSGGIGDLLKQFQQNGHGDTVNSWVASGPNKQISPGDLANALGADNIQALTAQTGMDRDELLGELSRYLPEAVDELTPHGNVPSENDLAGQLGLNSLAGRFGL
ncbi:MAG: YidB family protein [Xanthobacteraceae bacterium]|nr:YidB family protein [Xanthobacteraceae bacterium]